MISLGRGALCVMLLVTTHAFAQNYPNKPIRLVLPYPPGGGTDVIARPLAQKLGEYLGQQVIVDNRGGAGGNIGMEFVAKSPPDGYTLLFALTAQFAVNPSLYPKLPYDPVKDYAPISLLANAPYLLIVHPSVPAKSVRELIALIKAHPGELAYSSSGNGSGAHLAGEMSAPHIRSGRLRALGVTTAQRSPMLPDLPAIAETVAGYDSAVWYGFATPAGTPREIVGRLNSEVLRVLAAPDFRNRITLEAVAPIGSTPEEFADFIRSEIVRWAKVVKDSGAKVD